MVHSTSASPMKTTSISANISEAAPPEQETPPVVLPLKDTDKDLSPNTVKLAPDGLNVIAISDVSQPSTRTPEDNEPSIVTPLIALQGNLSSASDPSSTHSTTPTQGTVNGRTSGRKRVPKACDCCGSNSKGHNFTPPGRGRGKGRGRGRGRGRGAGRNHQDTPNRNDEDKLMRIKDFDLIEEELGEAEVQNEEYENIKISNTQSEPAAPSNVSVSRLDGPVTNCVVLKKENMLTVISAVAETERKRVGEVLDIGPLSFPGITDRGKVFVRGRGKRGRGRVACPLASKREVISGIKQGVQDEVIINSQEAHAPSQLTLHDEQMSCTLDIFPTENGDEISLSESEADGESLEDIPSMTEPGSATLCASGESTSPSRPGRLPDHNSEMQLNLDTERTDLLSVCLSPSLSNGNATSPTDHDHTSTPMDTDTANSAVVSSYCVPIAVCSSEHSYALRDHRLYCQTGTWEKTEDLSKDLLEEPNAQGVDDDGGDLERLIHLVHEFLESFYIKYGSFIPLSEADVLDYLKENCNCDDLSNKALNIQGEMKRYREALASAPVAGFMVMYNKHTLRLEDLSTLEEQNWINDQIINTYGELIMEATQNNVHFFNSFFHKQLVAKGYEGVKRWTKKVDLFSKWLLLFPIHLEIHWSLVTVTMATKTINYFDSQGIVFRHTTDNIMKYLQSEAQEKKQVNFLKGWKIAIIKGIPQQKNDSDCGVFVLEYCRCLSVKQPLLFSQEDMPHVRKRIYKELCDQRLNS